VLLPPALVLLRVLLPPALVLLRVLLPPALVLLRVLPPPALVRLPLVHWRLRGVQLHPLLQRRWCLLETPCETSK